MVYVGGDNDLDPFAVQDLEEMELVGSSAGVNVVVEVDTRTTPIHGTTEAQRLRIVRDPAPGVQSPPLARLGEIDMRDWRNLVDFVDWAVASFPATRYALILWDHGGEWAGVIQDASGPPGAGLMTPFELELALQTIQNRTGIARLDLIGFDACLMAGIEVDAALVPYARARVASQEVEPGSGWAYDAWLGALAANPRASGLGLGREIAASYVASLAATPSGRNATASVVDLDLVPRLEAAVDQLAQTPVHSLKDLPVRQPDGLAIAAIPERADPADALVARAPALMFAEIAPARRKAIEFGKRKQLDPAVSVDLLGFVEGLRATTGDAILRADCDSVVAALRAAVSFRASGALRQAVGGVAIYFPIAPSYYDSRYAQTIFALTNAWTAFLDEYLRLAPTDAATPAVQIASVAPQPPSASFAQPLQIALGPPAPDLYRQTAAVFYTLSGRISRTSAPST